MINLLTNYLSKKKAITTFLPNKSFNGNSSEYTGKDLSLYISEGGNDKVIVYIDGDLIAKINNITNNTKAVSVFTDIFKKHSGFNYLYKKYDLQDNTITVLLCNYIVMYTILPIGSTRLDNYIDLEKKILGYCNGIYNGKIKGVAL